MGPQAPFFIMGKGMKNPPVGWFLFCGRSDWATSSPGRVCARGALHRRTSVRLLPAVRTASFAGSNPPQAQNKKPPVGWFLFCGRSDWVRTSDLYVPNVALYQAELHSDN